MTRFIRQHLHLFWFTCSVFASLVCGFMAPAMYPVPIFLFNVWAVSDFLAKTPRKFAVPSLCFGVGLGAVLLYAPVSRAIEFSLLFANTENALKTCLLDEIATTSILAAVIFNAIRVYGFVRLGMVFIEGWGKRQQNQKFSEEVEIVGTGIAGVIVIGLLEPLFVGDGCGGGGDGGTPDTDEALIHGFTHLLGSIPIVIGGGF